MSGIKKVLTKKSAREKLENFIEAMEMKNREIHSKTRREITDKKRGKSYGQKKKREGENARSSTKKKRKNYSTV